MVNYTNSKVYKIWSTLGNNIYVGSTTKQYLSQRMDKHRECYRQWKKTSERFITSFLIFDEYGLENCFIELLEAKECNSKDELRKIEGKYIRELECVNKVVAGRTRKEHYRENRDHIIEYANQYRIENKEFIAEKNNCECGGKYRFSNKSYHLKSMKHCKFIESQISKPEDDEV